VLQPPPTCVARRSLADEPVLLGFVDGFQFTRWADLDLHPLLRRYGLFCIPYVEWRFDSTDIAQMFRLSRTAGAASAWAVPLYQPIKPETEVLAFALEDNVANWLADDHIPYEPTMLVDDKFGFALLTWHTDDAFLCMRHEMFELYLSSNPTAFDLDGGGPAVSGLVEALKAAFERLDEWRVRWNGPAPAQQPLKPLPAAIERLRHQRPSRAG
jgi:hypothetical protein